MYSHSPSSRADFMPRVASHNDEPHTWLWGMTGEQEWTPEIKTGKFYIYYLIKKLLLGMKWDF